MTKPIPLEQRLRRLEEISQALESDNVELDTALALFAEGVENVRGAREILAAAELRIERLIENARGEPVLEPLSGEQS
jgi:exodeoxyribonuclease VII small subunit